MHNMGKEFEPPPRSATKKWADIQRRHAEIKARSLTTGRRNCEPDGAASGSQPIRSRTNRTSSAAGSRR
jgi:hypothetical protein